MVLLLTFLYYVTDYFLQILKKNYSELLSYKTNNKTDVLNAPLCSHYLLLFKSI